MGKEEWTVGDRVHVPRITDDDTVILTIRAFLGDEDDPNPAVELLLQEFRNKEGSNVHQELVRQSFRACRLSELEDPPLRRVRGGAAARRLRNMAPIECGCGCGQETSGAEFRQGHDMKLKGQLRRIKDGKEEGNVEAAKAELERRGWS